jgi:hypothetical protein
VERIFLLYEIGTKGFAVIAFDSLCFIGTSCAEKMEIAGITCAFIR